MSALCSWEASSLFSLLRQALILCEELFILVRESRIGIDKSQIITELDGIVVEQSLILIL